LTYSGGGSVTVCLTYSVSGGVVGCSTFVMAELKCNDG
jgi:hypothetical protein